MPTRRDESDAIDPAPFLSSRPAPWAVRGLATLVIALFVAVLLGALFVSLPETVQSRFELVPVHGTDPLRAPRSGTVTEVGVLEGQTVEADDLLLRLRSESAGDRRSEHATAETRRRGAQASLANAREGHASRRRADQQEQRRLETQVTELEERLSLKRDALAIARDVEERQRRLLAQGLMSETEFSKQELQVRREQVGVEELEAELADTRASLVRQRHEVEARAVTHREEVRRLEEEIRTAEIRIASLRENLSADASGLVPIRAPCGGSVLRLQTSLGSFVQDGDTLAEIACADQPLRARLTVPQSSIALVEPGQQVKLLYEAFPYQRFGVRFGEIESVSPAGLETDAGRVFLALARVSDVSIRVRGKDRPVLAGMGGEARIVVGRRSVASHALEPLRRLREAVRAHPEPEAG